VPKLKFRLPVAPPLNNAFFNVHGKGRKKTTRYKNWIKSADDYYVLQALGRVPKITTPYTCKMTFPKDLLGDLDGRAKLILDWMVSRDLTIDDKHCRKMLLEYGDWKYDVQVEVEPHEQDGESGT
jgi:hypothetical protein